MKQDKEETEKKITDCRSAAIPYAEEKRKLIEVVRDKEKNLQHIIVSVLVIYVYSYQCQILTIFTSPGSRPRNQ